MTQMGKKTSEKLVRRDAAALRIMGFGLRAVGPKYL